MTVALIHSKLSPWKEAIREMVVEGVAVGLDCPRCKSSSRDEDFPASLLIGMDCHIEQCIFFQVFTLSGQSYSKKDIA